MNYANKVLKGTASVFVISLIAALMGYLVRLVLARNLSVDDYGMFYAVFALFSLVSIFKSLGLNQAVAKFVPEYQRSKDYSGIKSVIIAAFSIQFIFSSVISIAAILLSDRIAVLYLHNESAGLVVRLLAVMFWLIPFENLFRFAFQGFQKMVHYSLVELLRMVFVLVFSLLLFAKDLGIRAPSYAYILVYVVVPLLCIPSFIRMFPEFFRARLKIDTAILKKLIRFGFPVMVGIFGAILLLYTDTIIIGYFGTLEDVALYQVASPTSRLLLYFGYAIAAVMLPLSSELWAKNKKEKLRLGIELVYKYSLLAVIPATFLVLSFPDLILKVLFGKEYVPASLALQILSVGIIFYTIGHINGNVLSGIGKPKENTRIVLYAALLNLALNIILIPIFGIIGAAGSTLVSYSMILALTSYRMMKHIEINVPWFHWLKTLMAGIVFVFLIYILKRLLELNVWAEAVISIGIASLVYLSLVFALKLITREDFAFFRYALRKK